MESLLRPDTLATDAGDTTGRRPALTRHLKRADGKGGGHSLPGVDFIYMINLDTRPEKYALARRYLEVYGITPFRFPAVNGWELSKEAIQDIGLNFQPGMTPLLATTYPEEVDEAVQSHEFTTVYGRTYFAHCMALGAMGCTLSHLSVLQDAWESGYDTVWVMEDDIDVVGDPNIIPDLLAELKGLVGGSGWDILFTDLDYRTGPMEHLEARGAFKRPDTDCRPEERYSAKYTETVQLSPNLRRVSARFGSTSMLVSRTGMAKLLDFFGRRGIYGPYDLDNLLPDGLQRYGLTFDLVTNMLRSLSDIGALGSVATAVTVETFARKYPGPIYQDLAIGAQTYRIGTEYCETRYELMRPVLDRFRGPFSVLDVGAAQGYFSFRIAQDHPQAGCVMVESDDSSYYAHHGSMLNDLCRLNGDPTNLVHLDRRLSLADLRYLEETEHFDLVLGLLVVHLMDENLTRQIDVLEALIELGDHVILEVADDVGVLCTAYVEHLARAAGARWLGEVKRHKDPRSDATGALVCFSSTDLPSPVMRPDRGRVPIRVETFSALNGRYPPEYASRGAGHEARTGLGQEDRQ